MAALETSLRSERQQNDEIVKQLADFQAEIGELQRKLEDADGRNMLLQDSLQRFHSYLSLRCLLIHLSKCMHHVSQLTWISLLLGIQSSHPNFQHIVVRAHQ
jgi:myosin-5